MTQNECLANLRRAVSAYNYIADSRIKVDVRATAGMLAEIVSNVEALDEYLSYGGKLPTAWKDAK